ncbi:MAG: PVC-type heme-binding CxxCH protein [Verrucomicrobiales bacterium]
MKSSPEFRTSDRVNQLPPASYSLALAAALLATTGDAVAQAQQTPADALQPSQADIPAPDPEVERSSFELAPGLEVNLFAADPMLKKPVQIAWDGRGRLWVASSETYPQIKPGEPSEDKIVVLEDTNGDGVADTSTTFADNLLIPTGLFPVGPGEAAVLGCGTDDKGVGCYVANSTELIFLRDKDGDGRADKEHVMLSGFGTEDTHHIIHTFRGAPDGGFYFNQSIYIHTHLETPWGVRRLGGGGVWYFRPETGQAEILTRGQVNAWGHVVDRWGQSFTTDGAYSEGVNYAFPGAAFFWAKEDDWTKDYPRILKGLNPGQPKHCSLEIISGRHFPEDWQGTMVLPDFRGNRINRFVITDQGSGYAGKQVEDLIKTTHRSFRPVDLSMGPDGALYIADWYNPIIQHGEVDFRDPRRDHTHGRIWRVTAKGRELVKRPELAGAEVDDLIGWLKAPEAWTRFFAKRELRERGGKSKDDKRAIDEKWSQLLDGVDIGNEEDARFGLELLWVNRLNDSPGFARALTRLTQSGVAPVRAGAYRALYQRYLSGYHVPLFIGQDSPELRNANLQANIRDILAPAVADAHPRVRLEAIHCLRALGSPQATETALQALNHSMDENLDFALWQTCRDTADVWLPAFEKGETTFGGNFQHVVFALKATGNPAALEPLVAALRDGKIGESDRVPVVQLISQMGQPAELGLLLEARAGMTPASLASGLDLLAQTIRVRNVQPAAPERALAFLDHADPSVRRAAARLCGALKLEPAREKLIVVLMNPGTESADLQAALDGMMSLGGDATPRIVSALAGKADAPLAQRAAAIGALVSINVEAAALRAVEVLAADGGTTVAPGLFEAFVTRRDGPAALAAALDGKKLPESVAQAGLQKASSAGTDTQSLQDALAAAGKLKPINQTLTADEMNALVAEVRDKGDPHRGELVYRRAALLCQTCHAIGGGGPEIGPNLLSIGASAQIDYLIESMLNPSVKIKEGYHTNVITTKDGAVLAGAIVAKDGQTVTLRDAAGQTQAVPAQNIHKNEILPISLMPPGLTASLRKDEFLDLIKFMSELGREGDFKVPPQNYVRRWRLLQPNELLGRAHNLQGDRLFASADPALVWMPAYSTASGALAGDEIPTIKLWNNFNRRVAQFDVTLATPGPITLAAPDPTGVKFIHGEQLVDAQPRTTLTLPAGTQTITVFYDPGQRPSPLLLELVESPGAQLVTGR